MANCPSMHSNSRFMFTGCSWFISGEKNLFEWYYCFKTFKRLPLQIMKWTLCSNWLWWKSGGWCKSAAQVMKKWRGVPWSETRWLVPDCDHTTVQWLDRSPPPKMFKWLLHRATIAVHDQQTMRQVKPLSYVGGLPDPHLRGHARILQKIHNLLLITPDNS